MALSALRIGQVLVASLQVKFALWWETYQMTSKGLTPPPRSFAEEQSKYLPFRIREQIEAMLQLVIPLGYVLIFGAVAPITVPMCFAVFVVQLRASAHLLASTAKRTVPRRQVGVGHWKDCVA